MKFCSLSAALALLCSYCSLSANSASAQELLYIGKNASGREMYLNTNVETDETDRNIKFFWTRSGGDWTYDAVHCRYRFQIFPLLKYRNGESTPIRFTNGQSYTVNRGTIGDDLTREVCKR